MAVIYLHMYIPTHTITSTVGKQGQNIIMIIIFLQYYVLEQFGIFFFFTALGARAVW